jgi:dephospho-CoA kinase
MMNTYNPNEPIILGLAGKAATGKTSVAEKIVPKAQLTVTDLNIEWDHIFFALPLYEMAAVKRTILGLRQRDRQLYSLHSIVYDLFGGSPIGGVPDYEDLISLVRDIYTLPIEHEDRKPRSFLQKAGDLCREVDPDCFAKWAINKSKSLYRKALEASYESSEEPSPFCVIISDVRFVNEAEHILSQPNGMLVCYEASDEVRDNRILKRDGAYMTEEQKNHKSEHEIDAIKDMASLVVNTDSLSIQEQANLTISLVNSLVGIYA